MSVRRTVGTRQEATETGVTGEPLHSVTLLTFAAREARRLLTPSVVRSLLASVVPSHSSPYTLRVPFYLRPDAMMIHPVAAEMEENQEPRKLRALSSYPYPVRIFPLSSRSFSRYARSVPTGVTLLSHSSSRPPWSRVPFPYTLASLRSLVMSGRSEPRE